jgi:hypothetical protein
MNATTDLDRVLGEWLGDGPTRAPDHPVEAAIEYARSHPRRRDPLAFLRPDPMAPRSRGLGARPVLLLAVLGLLFAAVVAVGVGSNRDSVVVGPSPSASETQAASPSPAASARGPVVVDVTGDSGVAATATIVDASGTLVGARAPGAGEPAPDPNASIPDSGVLVQNQGPTTLRLTWIGGSCERDYGVEIGASGRTIAIAVPSCQGDSQAIGREVLLEFSGPVDATAITATLAE